MQGSCWCYCKSHIYRRKPKAGTEEFERTRAARSIAEAILAKLVLRGLVCVCVLNINACINGVLKYSKPS